MSKPLVYEDQELQNHFPNLPTTVLHNERKQTDDLPKGSSFLWLTDHKKYFEEKKTVPN